MKERILSWTVRDVGASKKSSAWYWTVGIIAVGVSVASFIVGNTLLGLLAIIGAFTVMLAGSRPSVTRTYGVSETGIHIGAETIPFTKIKRFAISDDEPRTLALDTASLGGTMTLPLGDADFRNVRSELKNRNIDEVDSLESLGEKVSNAIGL